MVLDSFRINIRLLCGDADADEELADDLMPLRAHLRNLAALGRQADEFSGLDFDQPLAGDPQCEDWNGQLEGEWNENLHGLPREKRGHGRYGKVQLFNFMDGHAKAMPFEATYKSPTDNMWGVTES